MKAQRISVTGSIGRTLSSVILRADGKKLLAKGRVISEEDVRSLENECLNEVSVAQLGEGELGELDAVSQLADKIGQGALEARLAAGGRAKLFTTEPCCVLVNEEVLNQINSRPSMVVATTRNFTWAAQGIQVAVVKSAPFVVPRTDFKALLSIVQERGPILEARPIRSPTVAVLYTDPVDGERARQLFENSTRKRLSRFGASASASLSSVEEESAVAHSLQHALATKPTAVLIASTTAPAGPGDVIGRALVRAGCEIECFLAPLEPGCLLLLGYVGHVPIVCAPGSFRPAGPNGVDRLLPPMLAGYRVSKWEVAGLGHGGLLV